MNQQQFSDWLDTFVKEKGIDRDHVITVHGKSGTNIMDAGTVIDHMKLANASEQMLLHDRLVRLDFYNQPIMPFIEHLAQAIAI